MTLMRKLNQVIMLFVETFRQMGRGRIWALLLAYYILQALLLFAHYNFYSPVFYGLISAWSSVFGPVKAGAFSHYPTHFVTLPEIYGWAKIILAFLLEGLVLGTIAVAFAKIYFDDEDQRSVTLRNTLPLLPNLMAVWLIMNGLTMVAGLFLPQLFSPMLDGPRRLMAFNLVILPAFYIVILTPLFYALPAVAVYRINFLQALGRSWHYFVRRPFTTFFLTAFVIALPALVSGLTLYSADIVRKFKPETVVWLLFTSLFIEMIAYFFWMSLTVRFMAEPER